MKDLKPFFKPTPLPDSMNNPNDERDREEYILENIYQNIGVKAGSAPVQVLPLGVLPHG